MTPCREKPDQGLMFGDNEGTLASLPGTAAESGETSRLRSGSSAFTRSLAQHERGSGASGRSFTFISPGKSRLLWVLSYGRMLEKMLPDVVPPHEDLVNSQA